MAGAGVPDLPAPREVAYLLARFSCNAHTICDEELRVTGEAAQLLKLELRPRGGSPAMRQHINNDLIIASDACQCQDKSVLQEHALAVQQTEAA